MAMVTYVLLYAMNKGVVYVYHLSHSLFKFDVMIVLIQ